MILIASIFSALWAPLSHAAQATQIGPIKFVEQKYSDPKPSDNYLSAVWPGMTEDITRRIRSVVHNFPPEGHYSANSFWVASFNVDGQHYLLSLVDHEMVCQGIGAGHDDGPQPFTCPLKVSVVENDIYHNVAEKSDACYYRGATYATYDKASKSFLIYSAPNGVKDPDCQFTISIQK